MFAYPACPPLELSLDPTERYRRHLVLREVGPIGQARIRRGAVQVHGVGPAAEEAATYLVAAGVGRVILEPALHERLVERLSELNPDVVLCDAAILPLEVVCGGSVGRAEGAKAALIALLQLSGVVTPHPWREDPL